MQKLRLKQAVVVLISCMITLGEIQWISAVMLPDGIDGIPVIEVSRDSY